MISWRLVQKAKGILEKEKGTVRKPRGGRIAICLLYPNSYHVGMSNLGFQTVYQLLNSQEDVVCERAFLPDPEDLREYQATQTPLFSLESQKPLSDFDILAFSLSFENDFMNVLTQMELARIPLRSCDRGQRTDPLVIAGGVAAFINPEPLSDFFDLFILGEAEEVVGEFLEVYRDAVLEKGIGEKEDLLRRLGGVEGVYAPRFYHVIYKENGEVEAMDPEPGFARRVKRRWIREVDRFPTRSALFTPDTEFRDMALVEVNRGCPRGCRFCAACYVYHPFRNRTLSLLESLSKESLREESRIGLTGTAVSDYPHLLSLCQGILSNGGRISVASLRIDGINPLLVHCLKEGRVQSVAIAPEAGSERLRRVLRKGYTEEEIVGAVHTLTQSDLLQVKCYFMIGLPFEVEEDVKAIVTLAKQIRHQVLSGQKGRGGRWRLVLSVNPFIPKPATPFQWVPMEEVGILKRKFKALRTGIQGERGMEMIHDLPKWAYVQALLSRGDRRVGKILVEAQRHGGDWGQALRETSVNPDFYVYRRRGLDEVFPWDFIDHGIPKERLKEEYLAAIKEAGVDKTNDQWSKTNDNQ